MAILSCAVCFGEFESNHPRAKYCSRRCVDKGKPSASALTCVICSGPMVKSRTSKPQGEAAHNKCRTASGGLGGHGESGYRRGCRCGECKAGVAAKMRRYAQSHRAKNGIGPTGQFRRKKRGVEPLATIACFICREPLQSVRTHAVRYPLHKACRQGAPDWIRRGLDNPRRASFQSKIDKAAAGTTGGNRVFVNGGCAWCGELFTASAGVYCSDKCKVSAKFKRRSSGVSFSVSPRVRTALYERDSWTCQLCGRSVDRTFSHRDKWSASLDHIIPQSHMLIPDHSPSNLRLVHKMCNSMRGDGSNMTEAEFRRRIAERFQEVAA